MMKNKKQYTQYWRVVSKTLIPDDIKLGSILEHEEVDGLFEVRKVLNEFVIVEAFMEDHIEPVFDSEFKYNIIGEKVDEE